MSEPQIVLEDVCPNGNIQAIAEQDERVAYFYLNGAPETEFGVRSCWVRNLREAPLELDVKGMERGLPPMLPREFCRHPDGAPPLAPDELQVVWFEEGDAAALLSGSDVLAVIPSWSGTEGFSGYARDCIGESPLCWELGSPDTNVLFERIKRAAQFWASWSGEEDLWPALQKGLGETLETVLGAHEKYYAIDGGYWPPKAILRIRQPNAVVLVTIGVSIRPQPKVELYMEEPEKYRRIELGLCLSPDFAEAAIEQAARFLSAQSYLPWDRYTWLGEHHTTTGDVLPAEKGEPQFSAVLLLADPKEAPRIQLTDYRGDPVNLLWMVPITERERQFAVDHGSQELEQKLRAAGHGWIHRPRAEVP